MFWKEEIGMTSLLSSFLTLGCIQAFWRLLNVKFKDFVPKRFFFFFLEGGVEWRASIIFIYTGQLR